MTGAEQPHAALAVLLREGFQTIVERVHRRLGELGFDDVRPAHLVVFQHLDAGGTRIGEIARRAQLTNQSVGYLVDYLEEHGYVTREQDPRNRRATLVRLTEHGWREMEACSQALGEIEDELGARMGAKELRELLVLLEQFTIALGIRE
ncbi:MAG: MarR family transcriptional regulator [Dehalococcoidia bacterium]|nr:MarR family transcriptional regulator [Dehalococcoidia bacterium]